MEERKKITERPFEGKVVYFSVSIRGVINHDPNLPFELVQFIQSGGATVPSEHVAARSQEEMFRLLSINSGIPMASAEGNEETIRRIDMEWVDQASHMVALVDGPSSGVGMELERAILKPQRGLALTPILALIHVDNLPRLTAMIKGVTDPQFKLETYRNAEEAKEKIQKFLSN